MIQEHELNIELSRQVYENLNDLIEPKRCYDNVWFVTTYGNRNEFRTGEWKIAYGFVKAIDRLLVRHCFIVNDNGEVIDPTIVSTGSFKEDDDHYYISYALLNLKEYHKLIEKDRNPTLFTTLRDKEKLAREWGNDKDIILYW
jgi:hypothetical protein